MKLSVIVVSWNSKSLTAECIESVLDTNNEWFTSGEYEFIVIDNGSSDGSLEYLESLGNRIKLIANSLNTGYAHACNLGISKAIGEYILLLGSDTKMTPGTLKICLDFLESNSDAGAAGCRLLNMDGTVQNSCKKFPKLRNAFYTYLSLDFMNKEYDMADFKYDETIEVQQVATTFLMIRKSVLDKCGMFNEKYRILYNDVDLCKRIYGTGSRIYFLPGASVFHHGSHSTKKADYALRKIMYSDIYRYYKDNFGFKAVFLYPILAFRLFLVSTIKR